MGTKLKKYTFSKWLNAKGLVIAVSAAGIAVNTNVATALDGLVVAAGVLLLFTPASAAAVNNDGVTTTRVAVINAVYCCRWC